MNTQINLHLVNEGSNIDRVVLINGEMMNIYPDHIEQSLLETVLEEIDRNFDKTLQDTDQDYQLKAQQEQEQWHEVQDAYYAKLLGGK